jgi:hypothetical protein
MISAQEKWAFKEVYRGKLFGYSTFTEEFDHVMNTYKV